MTSEHSIPLEDRLDLLILRALHGGATHSLDIARSIGAFSGGTVPATPRALFPALHRMEEQGWLASSWSASANGRRGKGYRLTAAGRRRLGTASRGRGCLPVWLAPWRG